MVITHYCALGGFSRTGQRLHGAALRSGAPGTGQAERAGRERGTGGNERPAGRPHVMQETDYSAPLERLAGMKTFWREQVCPLLRTGMTQTAGACCSMSGIAYGSGTLNLALANLLTHMPLRMQGHFGIPRHSGV